MKKGKRLIDQIYGGAFENAQLDQKSKKAVQNAGFILLGGALISLIIGKSGKL